MGYELDFLAVGEGEKSGDAIAIRRWKPGDLSQKAVIVIDGGYKESGQELVDHLKTHYKTTRVDLAVDTFAVELLQKGVSLENVAVLLGSTIKGG